MKLRDLMLEPPRPRTSPLEAIGRATISEDGTLSLHLRAEDGAGRLSGHGVVVYTPDHPSYGDVLAHIGPMQVGEEKLVLPWPE